jgi:HD-GYP domain-containing protein (c-di-GMP phosphodiesterase class II)
VFKRDPVDVDIRRKEITWVAILCLFIVAVWQLLATCFGGALTLSPRSYDEKVLFGGMGAILLCSVLYIAVREREQRHLNQRLLASLREAITCLNDRVRQLRSLCFASTDFTGTLDVDHICRLTVDTLASQLKNSACLLTLTIDTRKTREFRAGLEETAEAAFSEEIDFSRRGPTISTSIQTDEVIIGQLSARRAAGDADFSPEEMSLLVTLGNMAARALDSARLHEDLKESYLCTLRTLVGLLGARDNYTASHAMRVSSLSIRFAQQLNLPEDLIQILEEFAPLHDLGKIGIPDGVLLKAGPLDAAERTACEEHPQVGEEILRPLRPDVRALAMIRNHHEHWDGSGYPDRLRKEETPLLARLLHIVDCYDAILSERPYSPKHSPHHALSQIQLESGHQFDPTLANAFITMLTEDDITWPEDLALFSYDQQQSRELAGRAKPD